MSDSIIIILSIVIITIPIIIFYSNKYNETIHLQAMLERKIIIEKWLKYKRIREQYKNSDNKIVPIEEVNEAEQDLRTVVEWYNKKYKRYGGYCCPPELLFDLED